MVWDFSKFKVKKNEIGYAQLQFELVKYKIPGGRNKRKKKYFVEILEIIDVESGKEMTKSVRNVELYLCFNSSKYFINEKNLSIKSKKWNFKELTQEEYENFKNKP